MAGERLIQVIDIARFRAIRPALDELDAARALSLESHAVLQEAAASPFAHSKSRLGFAVLLARILRHPELELRVFLEPRELDGVIEGVMHVLCFENGAESSLVTPAGLSWVVLDRVLAVFGDLDWFRTIFDPNSEERQLPYPRAGFEGRYSILSREDLARVAAALQPLLDDPIPTEIATLLATRADQRQAQHTQDGERLQRSAAHSPEGRAVIEALDAGWSLDDLVLVLSQEVRPGAEGLARLAAKALSREELTLAHASLL